MKKKQKKDEKARSIARQVELQECRNAGALAAEETDV